MTVVSETEDGGEYVGVGEYEYGDEAEITVNTLNGYTFAGWYADDVKLTDEKTVRMSVGDGDEVLIAKFEEYFLEITVNGAKGNLIVLHKRAEVGTEVSPVSFIPETPEGVWDGWYENGEKIAEDVRYSFVMPRADRSIEARWVADGVRTAAEFADKIASGEDIELASDIDFAGVEWTTAPEYFGEINGNGYAVLNISVHTTVKENGVEYAGLFARFGGEIYDIAFENVTVEVSAESPVYAGLFAGRVDLTGTVRNVTVSGILNVTTGTEYAYVGGFAGENKGEISDVSVTCEINVSPDSEKVADIFIGGFAGRASDLSIIKYCDATGSLKVKYSANGNPSVRTDDFAAVAADYAELENNSSDIEKFIMLERF